MKFCIPNEFKSSSGVYVIKSTVSDDMYVGCTNNLYRRFCSHRTSMKNGNHFAPALKKFVNEKGYDVLEFHLYKVCGKSPLARFKKECQAIIELSPTLNTQQIKIKIDAASMSIIRFAIKGYTTITELSNVSGVSYGTITNALSDGKCTKENLEKIMSAITKLQKQQAA